MDIAKAKRIVEILADGINPVTGEELEPTDSCNQVEVVRALHTLLKSLTTAVPERTRQASDNAGKPWSVEDEEELGIMFDDGISIREICRHFGRSRGAIAARLVKLGKIEERAEIRTKD